MTSSFPSFVKSHLDPIGQFGFDVVQESAALSSGRDVGDSHWPCPLTEAETQAELPRFLRRGRGVDPRHRALGGVAGAHDPAKVRLPALLPDRPEVRGELARYADAVTRLDRGIGMLLEMLEEQGVADCTLVVFLSDNGMESPSTRRRSGKGGSTCR